MNACLPADPTQRLFVDQMLGEGMTLSIVGAQAHYLLHVLRLRHDDSINLCDDITGEWRAVVLETAKRDLLVQTTHKLRPREVVPDLWLAAAPIRRQRYDWVAEKACELGVARFVPVRTARAVVDKVKDDRLRAHMIEAAEQCGRTALPELADMISLQALLTQADGRTLFFADEAGGAPMLAAVGVNPGPALILIGPEGGFDAGERAAILAHPDTCGVSLGPRVLRADTAAVAAIAIWMSAQP